MKIGDMVSIKGKTLKIISIQPDFFGGEDSIELSDRSIYTVSELMRIGK